MFAIGSWVKHQQCVGTCDIGPLAEIGEKVCSNLTAGKAAGIVLYRADIVRYNQYVNLVKRWNLWHEII